MNLLELLKAVKEENLTKTDLDNYHTALSGLYSDLQLEIATLKKEKAIYEATAFTNSQRTQTAVEIKTLWKASEKGQRLIQLEGYARATSTQLRSLKNRLYNTY